MKTDVVKLENNTICALLKIYTKKLFLIGFTEKFILNSNINNDSEL